MSVDNAIKRAEALLNEHGFTQAPIDMQEVADICGYKVRFEGFKPEECDVLAAYQKAETREIFVNQFTPAAMKGLAIAHEIGHALLHPQYVDSASYEPMPRSLFTQDAKTLEDIEAEAFARHLLVPQGELEAMRDEEPAELARIFIVPRPVVLSRLADQQQGYSPA